jgi:hypothetical protein
MMTVVAVLTVLCLVVCVALTVRARRDARRSDEKLARLLDADAQLLQDLRFKRGRFDRHRRN